MQNGFESGRTIHTTIDAFFAVKRLVDPRGTSPEAIALLLDFTNAFDSLRCD